MHSRSPWIHNPGYGPLGLDAVYLPFHVDCMDSFMKNAEAVGIDGMSVTIPHKEWAAHAAAMDEAVRNIGSCNTLYRRDGRWHGTNSDAQGFLGPLMRLPEMAKRHDLHGLRCAVLGAGGSARAVIYALQSMGAHITIYNRTLSRAQALAADFNCQARPLADFASLSEADKPTPDIIVQTTSLGLTPNKRDPAPGYAFCGTEIVYDIIYTPPRTPFLKRAAVAGCRVLNGKAMLIEQGLVQFQLFTGKSFPAQEAEIDF